jgi:hypothetical protein
MPFMKPLAQNAPRLGFSALALNAVKRRTMRVTLPHMASLFAWEQTPRSLTLKEFGQLLRYTWWEPIAWARMVPLMLLPRSGLDALRWLRRKVRGRATVSA